ncbi:MAG: hypothetical protein M3X11_08210 [Acidobacteriota bacterium]|nr:hypothetical protein [Acidobacteriota bacterium]
MLKSTVVRIVLVLLAALLAAGGWLYTHRAKRIELVTYVPESALGFLEINDLPQLLTQTTSTKAWQLLAPAYGISGKLGFLGKVSRLGWLASLAGNQEAVIFSQAQVAIIATSLEVRGEAVKPRLALVAETHSQASALQSIMEKRLPELAHSLFGQVEKQTSEYAGVPVVSFGILGSERKLLAARIDSELILANHEEPLRACIDTRLGHAPSIAGNFYLPKARPTVGANASIFGFVTAEGVKRLLRFGTYMVAGEVVGKAALAGAVGDVFTDFSAKTCDGIAYGTSFADGRVIDRYALLFKPELTERLKTIIKAAPNQDRALNLVPASAREVTVINIINPSRMLDEVEKVVSSRVDAAQSFLLHQFLIGLREAAFGKEPGGTKSGEFLNAAVDDEIISFNLTNEPLNRVWLLAARDRTIMARLAENMLAQVRARSTAAVRHENVAGFDVMNSSEPSRGAAVFIGDVLALGPRAQLLGLIEAHRSGQRLTPTPQFTSANQSLRALLALRSLPATPLTSFSSVKEESNEMMILLARAFGTTVIPPQVPALEQLPLAASTTSLSEQGLLFESQSPFGNLPFLVSLADGSITSKEQSQ